jgi:hypothetical protein
LIPTRGHGKHGRLLEALPVSTRLLGELASERHALALLQTVPGVDLIGAALLAVRASLVLRRPLLHDKQNAPP